jgi:hypothetical protein
MREHASRLLAFAVLILGIAVIGFINKDFASASQQNPANKVYFPIVHIRSHQPSSDLSITHMGLYQSVQSHTNDVILIARKPAILRIFAQVSQTSTSPITSRIRVDGRRNGQFLGTLTTEAEPVSSNPSIENMGSTFNLDLPVDWLTGELELTATVDDADVITELNEGNNAFRAKFTFHAVAPLKLTIVPITYTDTVTGKTYSKPGYDPISDWLRSAFPISDVIVNIHSPIAFTGDLRQAEDWGLLLEAVTSLWGNEVGQGSSIIYYGLIPNTSADGSSWFNGGISGLGWVGQRVSIGIDLGPDTGPSAAHEIGHNLGRSHAPCGNPSGVDPNFPYANASIGVYGVDTTADMLMTPDQTHDIMSYCGPEWVSDYTYEALFQDQSIRGTQDGVTGDGVFVTALVDDSHHALLAENGADRTGTAGAGQIQVQVVDRKGVVLGTYPAQVYAAEEEGVSVSMLGAFVPTTGSEQSIKKFRFMSGETVIAEQLAKELIHPQQ